MARQRRSGRYDKSPKHIVSGLLILVMVVVTGCGGAHQGPHGGESLRGTQLDQAQRLYSQLKRAESLQQDRKSLDLANTLLDYYPGFARNDEVIAVAVEAAARLGDRDRALGLTNELLERFPESLLVDRVLARGVELAASGGDTLSAADYLILAYDRHPLRGLRTDGIPRAAQYLDGMSVDTIEVLLRRHPESGLGTYLGYLKVNAALAQENFALAADAAARLEDRWPEDRWTLAALAAVGAGGRPQPHLLAPRVDVDPHIVGVMVPLTGRYAVLGNAFYEAAVLATDASNLEYGTSFVLKLEDTAADPVTSALAARKLCDDAGSIAVLGGLLSGPTASAAVVCDLYGTPLVSPTATNDNIWQLGPSVFQTNITGLYEVRLLAYLAAMVMDKQRFAIIYPNTPVGLHHAQVFQSEIGAWGGEIVATEAFPPRGTDFKDQIIAVRKQRPEVIFTPASVDQMVLLGPQLDFYRAGALIMGLSNWNSSKLRSHSDTGLERAVFPDDLVMFPTRWEVEFNRTWDSGTYPPEATAQALKAYQATRMVLDVLAQTGALTRVQLAAALTHRLSNQDFDLEGPESFAPIMRIFHDHQIRPFPAELFADGWAMSAATSDSAAAMAPAAADSLVPVVEPAPLVNPGDEVNGEG